MWSMAIGTMENVLCIITVFRHRHIGTRSVYYMYTQYRPFGHAYFLPPVGVMQVSTAP